jgi:hypothetical protein
VIAKAADEIERLQKEQSIPSFRFASNKKDALKDRGNDLYETPVEAVHALLKAEQLPQVIWEPACGPGAIVRVLRGAGHSVLSSDLVDYASPFQDWVGWDFLLEQRLPDGVEAIVTNPPFKNATAFVKQGLRLCPKVCLLLRLLYIESEGRSDILDSGQLARVHVFRNRLPGMHRNGYQGRQASTAMAFAWFVWDRDHQGPTELHRISWEPLA